uniref:Ras-GEF domain-containing protein n=1 Tax=Acrobeloides nanus TaxID=290746 RepID=A0A914D4F4_9BILA
MTKLFKEDNNFEMLRKFTDSRKLPCIPFLGLYLTDIAYCTAVKKKDPQQAYQQEQNINGILRVIASFQDSNYGNGKHNILDIFHTFFFSHVTMPSGSPQAIVSPQVTAQAIVRV